MNRRILFVALSLALSCQNAVAAPALTAIPYPLEVLNLAADPGATPGSLTLTATKGTDLYLNADGSQGSDNTPRVLFRPVGDFILSARVTAQFQREFDGAALLVYGDSKHWAKLLYEQPRKGKPGVSSTVARDVGDDAHHGVVPADAVYLKVARLKDLIVFYTSTDGATWNMVRNVGMPSTVPLRVGFSVQSPVGERLTAQFSNISYRAASFTNFWQGE